MRNLVRNKKISTALKEYFREKWITNAKICNKGIDYLELALLDCETNYLLIPNSCLPSSMLWILKESTGVLSTKYQRK